MPSIEAIRRAPKVELHDHLDGGLRPATVLELAAERGISLPASDPAALGAWFRRGADRKSLSLYLEGFAHTLALLQDAPALERVSREAIEDLAAEGLVYAEIRFAPSLHLGGGLRLEEVVEAALRGLEAGSLSCGLRFGLILCAMRNMPGSSSLEIAKLAVAYRDRGVVGFDIAGDEKGHPPARHLEAFQFIRNANFTITIHAGEAFGPESIWQAIQTCGAHRIGHGTRIVEDMKVEGDSIRSAGSLASFIRDRRIPLECCLSSNVQTGAAASYEEHPFILLYRNKYRVFLCTDNRLMSGTSLTREMAIACESYGLRLADLEKLTINAMKSAFACYDERVRIIYQLIKPGYAALRAEFGEEG